MSSILADIKQLLGVSSAEEAFDVDITVFINAAFAILCDLGIGSRDGFSITDDSEEWDDFIDESSSLTNMVKQYIFLKCKVVFDPPANSTILGAYNSSISELEFRMMNTNLITEE